MQLTAGGAGSAAETCTADRRGMAPRLGGTRGLAAAAGLFLVLCAVGPAGAGAQAAVSEDKAAEWFAKLRGSQAAVAQLETSVADLGERLAVAERALANASRAGVALRPQLATLAKGSAANKEVLHEVLDEGTVVQAETKNVLQEVSRVVDMSSDTDKAASKVSKSAEQVLSLGQFKGRQAGCLDSPAPTTSGGKVQMWACLKAQSSQQWEFNTHNHAIKHMHGICLAAPDPGTAGTKVLMFACDATLKSQQWAYNDTSGLVKSAWGPCLATVDPEKKGAEVALASCDEAAAGQQWKVVPGMAGLRQKLDGLNTELWKMQDPASSESVEVREAEMVALEESTDKFEREIAGKAKTLIGLRLRPMARRWRRSIRRVGQAALGEDPFTSTGPAELGETLGLSGALL